MGRIEKQKRLLIEEANKRLLREQNEEKTELTPEEAEWNEATKFCAEVEKWWEGSDQKIFNPREDNWPFETTEYVKFFERFQGITDNDKGAAEAYNHMIMDKLKKEVDLYNIYYNKIKDWLSRIVDEIDDWFQNPENCTLTLLGPDGKTETYEVDPEIDV